MGKVVGVSRPESSVSCHSTGTDSESDTDSQCHRESHSATLALSCDYVTLIPDLPDLEPTTKPHCQTVTDTGEYKPWTKH